MTGHPADSLATTSVLEAVVPASAIDPDYVGTYPDFVGTRTEPLGVTVVTTITPDGGRVRTSRLAGADATTRLDLPRAAVRRAGHRPARPAAPAQRRPPRLRRDRPRRRHRPAAHPRRSASATAPRCARAWPPSPRRRTHRARRSGCACWPPTATSSTTRCPRCPIDLIDGPGGTADASPRARRTPARRPRSSSSSSSKDLAGGRHGGLALSREPAAHRPVLA